MVIKCLLCNVEFKAKTKARMYCSNYCKDRSVYLSSISDTTCIRCGKIFKRSSIGNCGYKCRSCRAKDGIASQDKSGSKSPTWKGGFRYWSRGRFGRDKDGLSWKFQRRLTWERDKYTCTICGKRDENRKPDVHHIVPYRISFSHRLDNLVCLCNKCHHEIENKCSGRVH